MHSKSEINEIIKRHGWGTIESDRRGGSYGSYLPYRTADGKPLKGISLYRTSPVTITDAGYQRGKEKVNELFNELCTIGTPAWKDDLAFEVNVKVTEKKTLSVKATSASRNGLEYDQTFHYLNISIS